MDLDCARGVPEEHGHLKMPLNDPMMLTNNGPPLLCLSEMAEWNRLATLPHSGLVEWRLMGHTMVPVQQAWEVDWITTVPPGTSSMEMKMMRMRMPGMDPPPTASKKRNAESAFQGPATVLSQVANALIPGAEVILRMNAKGK